MAVKKKVIRQKFKEIQMMEKGLKGKAGKITAKTRKTAEEIIKNQKAELESMKKGTVKAGRKSMLRTMRAEAKDTASPKNRKKDLYSILQR